MCRQTGMTCGEALAAALSSLATVLTLFCVVILGGLALVGTGLRRTAA